MTSEEDAIVPLTGKHFFSVIMANTHVARNYSLQLPAMARRWFPAKKVPITLFKGAKSWKGYYYGDRPMRKFDPSWKAFVNDNKLSVGDACVFELLNVKKGEIKVQILRGGDTESETDEPGNTSTDPILLLE
ncbi:hypothetical protein H6P81_008124 [Aristolochia fimbriata]|uniref:TF-B3 domain-containing protein n=1 Tax=Aristolochia fimbriata TaxID=158543 RepID=A0AAV7F251_ARIFI|nr:hypothetical protein H6P81_008124 [Aristolochia fimbriata]